jgi:SAM-dependent methyltransferase
VRGSYTALPFADGSFDAVLCLGTSLGYAGEPADRAALREFRRVLAPGGRLVLETLDRDELGDRLAEREARPLAGGGTLWFERRFDRRRALMHEVQRLDDGAGTGAARGYDLRVYAAGELCRALEAAGLRVVARRGSFTGEPGDPSPASPLVLVAE